MPAFTHWGFHYRVPVYSSSEPGSRAWMGKGFTQNPVHQHPGIVGYEPQLEISNGRVTLRSTETEHRLRTSPHFAGYDAPASAVSFQIGDVLAGLLQDGDEIVLGPDDGVAHRALCVLRGPHLMLGLGAIVGWRRQHLPGADSIRVEESPHDESDSPTSDAPPLHFSIGESNVRLDAGEEATLGSYVLRAEAALWRRGSRRTAAVVRQPEDADRIAWRRASAAMSWGRLEIVRTPTIRNRS